MNKKNYAKLKEEIGNMQIELNKKKKLFYTEKRLKEIEDWEQTKVPLEFVTELEKNDLLNIGYVWNFPIAPIGQNSFILRNEDLISIIRRLKEEIE